MADTVDSVQLEKITLQRNRLNARWMVTDAVTVSKSYSERRSLDFK
jgi:hypothetical protein